MCDLARRNGGNPRNRSTPMLGTTEIGDADLRGTSTDGLDVYGARLAGSIRDPGFPDGC